MSRRYASGSAADGLSTSERSILDLWDQGHPASSIAAMLSRPTKDVQRVLSMFTGSSADATSVSKCAVEQGSADLLRAQLKAGQHVLELQHARVVALAIGLPTVCVRRGIGDTGPFKLREAR